MNQPLIHWSGSFSSSLLAPVPPRTLDLYQGASSRLEMNPVKGALGEWLLDRSITRGLFQTAPGPWAVLTPHRLGAGGIDNLFVRTTADGRPVDLLVAESKFGSSRLGLTRDGRQMTDGWIRPRLARTASVYRAAAKLLGEGHFSSRLTPPSAGISVPLGGGRSVLVGLRPGQVTVQGPSDDASRAQLQRQLLRMASYLDEASRGERSYRPRLFRISHRARQFSLRLDQLDPLTGEMTKSQHLHGSYEKLPAEMRELLRGAFASGFRQQGVASAEADRLAREACRDPALLDGLSTSPRVTWRHGLDGGAALAAGAGAFLAVLAQSLRDKWSHGRIDTKALLRSGLLAGLGGASSYYVSAQIQSRLLVSPAARSLLAALPVRGVQGTVLAGYGALGSTIASGLIVALGAYALGMVDAREARLMAVSSTAGALAGTAFTSGAMGVAFSVGTASTGTAISALSGAAATNAALAWLGGGAAAVGGGGMLVGGIVLTAGFAAVAVGVSAGVGYIASKMQEAERETLLLGRMALVDKQLLSAL